MEGPRRLLTLCFAVAAAWYLVWRWTTLNPAAPGLSAALLALETLALGGVLLQAVVGWRFSERQALALPSPQPATDVLVWAGSNGPDLLAKTLRSALALHGPHQVHLLAPKPDTPEGQRALTDLVAELGCSLTWAEGAHAEPAVLANHALAATHAPFVAWVDGSHACRRDFLLQTLGHFQDPQLAFVQTALGVPGEGMASAANTASNGATTASRWQHWLALFAPVLAKRRLHQGWDGLNATLWAGSGAVLRRSALQAAGGFSGKAADLYTRTTVRLQAQGLHGAWHPERMAFSLAPESEAARVAAPAPAAAWGLLLGEGVLHRPGLSLARRLRHLAHALAASLNGVTILALALPALTLASGALPIDSTAHGLALHLLPVLLLGALLQTEVSAGAHGVLTMLGHRLARLGQPAQAGLLGLNALAAVAAGGMAWSAAASSDATSAQATTVALLASAPLSPTACLGLGAWALGNALALGGALWAGQSTAGRARSSQRFTVTLAAELVNTTGERVQGTVDDLSDGGLRFYGSLLPSMAQHQQVSGTLHLPDGPLGFTGEVRHLGAALNGSMHQPRSVGLQLQLDAASKARIENFLFSSDLQWHLQGHISSPATPLGRMFPGLLPAPQPALARCHWNGAQLRLHVQAEATPVLCSASGETLVVSHSALPEHLPLILDVFRRSAVPSCGVMLQRIEDPASVGAAATALYTYRALPAPMPLVPVEHQLAASPFIVVHDEPLLIQPLQPEAPSVLNGRNVEGAALVAA